MSADFDKAIDRAVREMLDVEPAADLRARIVARIDELPAARFRLAASGVQRFGTLRFGRSGFGVLVGAAAVLVLAIGISLLSRPSVAPVTTVAGTDTNLPADARRVPVARETPMPSAQQSVAIDIRRRPAPTRTSPVVVAAALNEPENATTEIAPLKTVTPIDVAPITQRSIATEPVGVQPLNPITELRFTPLNPPDRRN